MKEIRPISDHARYWWTGLEFTGQTDRCRVRSKQGGVSSAASSAGSTREGSLQGWLFCPVSYFLTYEHVDALLEVDDSVFH